ncbi:TonB-dependent receptor [Sphingobium fuliginis]|uniref:TonB-dependent receptor n=1 Tax=Sphingobium fuliginis ATCC 27551 TaxID=1208342 RepID=A0A5B8CIC0_SPHSA|nr:TonB-dependent receptor [Sphingobium fuliginis]QDC37780.1 TonB-dependent receptor [Sphingobium fuliginis ATCC 27551]
MKSSTATIAATAMALSAPVHAQVSATANESAGANAGQAGEDSATVGEIVVTAQKRSESLQKVPLAVTAVTGADLERRGIRDVQGIVSSIPNLNLGVNLGAAKVALRGVGLENQSAAAEGSIAFHTDGVFMSRPIAALASFYDVQQVEVLRGPQGTLYGRNATGGSINITTRKPTEQLSGYLNVTGGNYARASVEGAVSGAIIPDMLAVRVAFQSQNRDGFGKNVITGNDVDNLNTRAIRGSVLFTPSDRLTIDLKGDYFQERDRAGAFHSPGGAGFSAPGVPIIRYGQAQGGILPTRLRDVSAEDDPQNRVKFWGVQGKISYALGDGIDLSALTAYRFTSNYGRTDLDGTNLPLVKQFRTEEARQFSEELQLSGKSDRLSWLIGLFYFHENTKGITADPLNPARTLFFGPDILTTGFLAGGTLKTEAIAAFGQASYEVVDKLRLTLGARYSSEKKTDHDDMAFDIFTPYDGSFATPQATLDRSKRFKSFTPRIALDYQATPDVLFYGSWSRGFKSGTYSLGAGTPPVDPETVSAFEAGMKSQLLDRRLRLNLAGFYYDYKNLQVGKVVGTTSATLQLENAATATIYGIEAEFEARIGPRFQIDGNAAWLHARFDSYVSADPARPFGDGATFDNGIPAFNLKGKRLSQSPDFAVLVGAQYQMPSSLGEFTLRGEVSWKDRVYFTPFNLDYVSQGPNARVNLFLNWASNDDHWTGSLFVKNLTNKTIIANLNVSSSVVGFPLTGYLEEPRTYGLTVGYKF